MTDRVAAITGAHGVLGRAVVEAAMARGLKVALIDHARGETTPDGALELSGVDLTDAGQARTAMHKVVETFGCLDIVLNIAGGFVWQKVDDAEPAWDRMFAINVKTALNAARAALPNLTQSPDGRIVNVGSAAALKSGVGMAAYTASKSGVHRLTESLAEELKDTSVTVNAVLPSIIDTPANRKDMPEADFPSWVSPTDIARVIAFLISGEARAVTGASLPVSRGTG